MSTRPAVASHARLATIVAASALALSGCADYSILADQHQIESQFQHAETETTPALPTPTAAAATPETSEPAPTAAEQQDIDVHELRIGDCFNEVDQIGSSGLIDLVGFVPCNQPHDYEVYWQADLPASLTIDEIDAVADDICYDAFTVFTGAEWEASDYYFTYLVPSAASIALQEDMTVDCLIHAEYDQVTRSLRDVGPASWADGDS